MLHKSILALQGRWRDRRRGTQWKVEGKVAREVAEGGSGSGDVNAGQRRYHFHCDEGKNGRLRACRGEGQDPRKHGVALHASGQAGPYSKELRWEHGTEQHWERLEEDEDPLEQRQEEDAERSGGLTEQWEEDETGPYFATADPAHQDGGEAAWPAATAGKKGGGKSCAAKGKAKGATKAKVKRKGKAKGKGRSGAQLALQDLHASNGRGKWTWKGRGFFGSQPAAAPLWVPEPDDSVVVVVDDEEEDGWKGQFGGTQKEGAEGWSASWAGNSNSNSHSNSRSSGGKAGWGKAKEEAKAKAQGKGKGSSGAQLVLQHLPAPVGKGTGRGKGTAAASAMQKLEKLKEELESGGFASGPDLLPGNPDLSPDDWLGDGVLEKKAQRNPEDVITMNSNRPISYETVKWLYWAHTMAFYGHSPRPTPKWAEKAGVAFWCHTCQKTLGQIHSVKAHIQSRNHTKWRPNFMPDWLEE